jgi:hypothetical protein
VVAAVAWVLGLGIFVALLLRFPRGMGILIAVVVGLGVLIAGGIWGYSTYETRQRETLLAKIETLISYDPVKCSAEYPLLIGFVNRTDRSITKMSFEVSGFREGYSDPVYKTPYASYSSDFIIKPGEGSGFCWRVPDKAYGVADATLERHPPETLTWMVTTRLPQFEE